MYSYQVIAAVLLAINVVVMATDCWQNTVTLYYSVGPSVVTLQQREAENIANEVLAHAKGKLTCSGLSTLTLINVIVTMPSNKYAITGTFGVIYGIMDTSQKQTALTCLVHAKIYNDIILNPGSYTSPIASSYWAARAVQSNYSQDTTCCISNMIVNSVCVNLTSTTSSPSVSPVASPSTMPSASPSATPSASSSASTVELQSTSASTTPSASPVSSSSTTPSASPVSSSSPSASASTTSSPSAPTTSAPTTSSPSAPTTASPLLPVLKCYTLSFTMSYNIPHLDIANLHSVIAKMRLIQRAYRYLQSNVDCKSVKVSDHSENLSRLDNDTVLLTLEFTMTSQTTPDDELSATLVTCLQGSQQLHFLYLLQNTSFPLTEYGLRIYEKQSITIHRPMSCCGDAQPPCCPGNSIKQSKDYCEPLNFVNYIQHKRVTLGDKITASCAVVTRESVTVSWKRNGITILSSGSGFNYTLAISDVETSDAGLYHCEVKNDFQIITKPFQLQVIVTQHVDMKLTLKNEIFHSDLLNRTSHRYKSLQLFIRTELESVLRKTLKEFEKIEVQGFSEGSVVVDFKVFMNQTLTTPQPNPPDLQGRVISVMINQAKRGSFGNLTVDSLILKVKPPPPSNIQVTDRGTTSIILSWQPPTGWQSYQIENYIIQYRIENQLDWKSIIVGVDRNSKRINGLITNTKYQFHIISRSSLGLGKPSSLLRDTTLTVQPIIANNGQNFTATVGQRVVLICRGSSDPRPHTVTWLRQAASAKFYTNITGNNKILNSYMVIRNVSVDDSGPYSCSATYKDVTNNGAVHLIVEVHVAVNMNVTLTKTKFTEDLKNKSSPKYQELSRRFVLTVSELYQNVTGFQGIQVLGFEKGSVKVSFRVVIVVKIDQPKAKGKQSEAKVAATNLIIRQVQTNAGVLGNGLTVEQESIQTDAPPNPPRNVIVSDIRDTVAHLVWTKPEYAEYFSVTHYIVKMKKHGERFEWEEKVTTKHVQLDCPLQNLQERTGYNVKVLAKSGGKYGLESKQEEFTTKDSKTSLLWLWILIAVVVVLGAAGVLYYKNKRMTIYRCDENANSNGSPVKKYQSDEVQICSYKNQAFAVPSLEFEFLGIMPGKWWEIPRASLTLQETLGSGAFGLVRKAQLDIDDGFMTCAVKMLKVTASDEDERDLANELEIMGTVGSHSNLVNLIGACTCDGPPLIVLEFAEKGSLINYLKGHVTSVNGDQVCTLLDDKKIDICLDIAKGMQHLANVKCVHRDLAARNVLLTGSGRAKISDFGLSRDVYERGFYEKKSQGKLPVRWMAPEAITQMIFTTQSDVWSYGIVVWEIETGGKLPYGGLGMLELANHLNKGHRLQRPSACREEIYKVMLHCWHVVPEERPSFDELCDKMEELVITTTLVGFSI